MSNANPIASIDHLCIYLNFVCYFEPLVESRFLPKRFANEGRSGADINFYNFKKTFSFISCLFLISDAFLAIIILSFVTVEGVLSMS